MTDEWTGGTGGGEPGGEPADPDDERKPAAADEGPHADEDGDRGAGEAKPPATEEMGGPA